MTVTKNNLTTEDTEKKSLWGSKAREGGIK
jgi:hypothetical protein